MTEVKKRKARRKQIHTDQSVEMRGILYISRKKLETMRNHFPARLNHTTNGEKKTQPPRNIYPLVRLLPIERI